MAEIISNLGGLTSKVMGFSRILSLIVMVLLQIGMVDFMLTISDGLNYEVTYRPSDLLSLRTYIRWLPVSLLVVLAIREALEFRRVALAAKPPSYKNDLSKMQAYTFKIKDYSTDYLRQPGFTSESLRAGSTIHPNLGEVRGCLHVLDSTHKAIGFAQVVRGHVVMPEHVLMVAEGGYLCGPQGGQVALNPRMFELIKTDVVVMPLIEAHRKLLAVKDADFRPGFKNGSFAQLRTTPLMDSSAEMISAGNIVQGKVQPNDMFGMVSFSGSTRPGMSGGGYYIDGALVAMHLCGGLANIGVSMGFIMESVARPEADLDTYEWLVKSAEYEGGFEWDYTHDPSTIVVKDVNNRYHDVDLDYAPEEFSDVLQMRKPRKGIRNKGLDYSGGAYEPEVKVGYDHQILKTGFLKDPDHLPKELTMVGKRFQQMVGEEEVEDQEDPVQVDDAVSRAQAKLHDYFKNLVAELAAEVSRPFKDETADADHFLEESRALLNQKNAISQRLQEINTLQHVAKKAQKANKDAAVERKHQQLVKMHEAKEQKRNVDASVQLLRTNDLKKKSKNARQNAKRKEQLEHMKATQVYLMEQLQKNTGQTVADLHQQMLSAMQQQPSSSLAGSTREE